SGWACDDLDYSYGAELSALTINDNTLELSVRPGEQAGSPCQLSLSPSTTYLLLSNRTSTVEAGLKRRTHHYRPLGGNILFVSGEMPLKDAELHERVPVPRPAGLLAAFFKEALARAGVKLNGTTRTIDWLGRQANPLVFERMVELGSIESPPLTELAREIL